MPAESNIEAQCAWSLDAIRGLRDEAKMLYQRADRVFPGVQSMDEIDDRELPILGLSVQLDLLYDDVVKAVREDVLYEIQQTFEELATARRIIDRLSGDRPPATAENVIEESRTLVDHIEIQLMRTSVAFHLDDEDDEDDVLPNFDTDIFRRHFEVHRSLIGEAEVLWDDPGRVNRAPQRDALFDLTLAYDRIVDALRDCDFVGLRYSYDEDAVEAVTKFEQMVL